ncbi:Smr/MutS family protein [Candidatus Ferrigenium straubiae]|uniref:Smr/MutS family protein n=1 Tax=Candidatus Ferrigenium straubiae TaxID=2919506 RepID=UPI003F4ABF12
MKKPADKIETEDAALFRAAVGEVQPLPEQNRIEPHKPPRRPLLRASAPPPEIPDTLSDFAAGDAPGEFLRNGLSRMALRKLRRSHWPVQDSLDLHGNTTDAARRLLQEFLHEAAQRGLRCVLVIHGKGMNSPGGEAVLRRLARHWLVQRPDVLAFCDAAPGYGGSGAALVLLKVVAAE